MAESGPTDNGGGGVVDVEEKTRGELKEEEKDAQNHHHHASVQRISSKGNRPTVIMIPVPGKYPRTRVIGRHALRCIGPCLNALAFREDFRLMRQSPLEEFTN